MPSIDRILLLEVAYAIIVDGVCVRIIHDTRNTAKTLAYLLLVIFLPVAGIAVYFTVGINYRKRKLYDHKLIHDEHLLRRIEEHILVVSRTLVEQRAEVAPARGLVRLLLRDGRSGLTGDNTVRLLVNGEEKFPALLQALEAAQHHIHMEYYIIERGAIADRIREVLMRKARAGVQVRLIHDDYGSRSIRGKWLRELRASGAEAFPFNRVRVVPFANRLNYHNHRKLVVVDGRIAFVGGINISDRYINDGNSDGRYWRDTHLMIEGSAARRLQHLFLADWNFCAGQQVEPSPALFPPPDPAAHDGESVQVAASGPDSPAPMIMLSLVRAITMAREEVLIATPYFIPGEAILEALRVAALGGVRVRILVPQRSDSRLVDAAAHSYFNEMLEAGVEIHLYQRGFIHAKTMVVDGHVAIVGTANMDQRSFELNFEVNAVVYSAKLGAQLRAQFLSDLAHADPIDPARWKARPLFKQLPERLARLASPLL